MQSTVYCTIQLDREGNVVEVLDGEGKPAAIKSEGKSEPAILGGYAPSKKKVKRIAEIQVVTTENEEHHDDPCWIVDSRGNWRCVCRPPLC